MIGSPFWMAPEFVAPPIYRFVLLPLVVSDSTNAALFYRAGSSIKPMPRTLRAMIRNRYAQRLTLLAPALYGHWGWPLTVLIMMMVV